MSQKRLKISLIYFVVFALLLVGLVPIMLVGWFLAGRSATELRAVENRYQIQLVQEKARQIEMFGQRYRDMVTALADAFALSNNPGIFASSLTDQQLSNTLKENPDLVALYVMPRDSESLALYRPGKIARQEIDSMAGKAIESISDANVNFGEPQIVASGGEPVITISAPVNVGESRIASVVAIVSLKRIGRDVVGMDQTSENDLWRSGLPIVFVVDSTGRAVFHPDFSLVKDRRPLSHLKIVEEWRNSYQQFQSGLVPFSAEFDGVSHEMIGAYSTVSIGPNTQFGVLTMQDEARALASVSEMRTQTWLISLAFALLALLIGSIAARSLTAPILHLSTAAEKISGGDLSTRVEARNITEIGTLGESFNTMADKLEEHIAKLAKAATENRELFVGTVKALAAAIDGKDKYTRGHSERVARISVAIGKQMNLPEDELEALRISALLHDVGKIAIDDNILKKPAALTPEEFEIMKTHPVKGYKIMSQIPAMREFLPGMYMHHEMVNGEGYPQGLTGDQIPLQAKIVSVADTFDAMTIDRPYSKGMQLQEALDRIRQLVGTRYDGAVVEALVRGCNAGEIGRGVVQSMAAAEKAGEATVNVGVAKGLRMTSNPEFSAERANIVPPPPPDIIQQNDRSN